MLLSVLGLEYYSSKYDTNSLGIEMIIDNGYLIALALVGNGSRGRREDSEAREAKLRKLKQKCQLLEGRDFFLCTT